MAFRLDWSQEALEDIESIAAFIERDSPVYARAVVAKIFEKAEILREFSELGRTVPELNDSAIREIFVYSYRLIYKVEDERILCVAVVHGRRLLENHQNKKND